MKSIINKASVTGIILAGGKSERMGSDKGLMKWKGRQFVEYSVATLMSFCSNIVISTNSSAYSFLGLSIVKDEHQGIGPMGGIHAGLKASASEHNIILSCDMPLIDEEVISLLLGSAANHQAVIPVVDKRLFPVCAYYHSSVLPILEQEIEAGLHKTVLFLQRLRFKELLITNPELQSKFFNINTIADFEHLKSSAKL
jgi:molybdopterin-guanine dinucleotide biosynthesis protein A